MNILLIIKTAFRALRKHFIRSTLSILGITIGIIAVIVTFSVGSGAEKRVHQEIISMGENATFIFPGNIFQRGEVQARAAVGSRLTTKDIKAIIDQAPRITAISRGYLEQQRVMFAGNSATVPIYGADSTIKVINNLAMQKGVFFNAYQVQQFANVAVLGNKIASSLFRDKDPLGTAVKIDGKLFIVIGVLDEIKFFRGTKDPNNRVYIPYTVAKKYFQKEHELVEDVGFIALAIDPEFPTAFTVRKIKRILRFMHDIGPHQPDDFTIFDEDMIDAAARQASYSIKLYGLIAALLALLVGGIGVMNIMLVAVVERKKEIGIKLSIGATQRAIQLQFLFEAIILSLFGGVVGVLASFFVLDILSRLIDLPLTVDVFIVIISLVLTIATGVFFGFYPAWEASHLEPIDALYEKERA